MSKFTTKHETLLNERLMGKTIREAAKAAGFTVGHADVLFSGCREMPEFKEEYLRRKKEWGQRLQDDGYLSLPGLIERWEDFIAEAKGGVFEINGEKVIRKTDLKAWAKGLTELGKLGGLYISKHEVSGKDGKAIELAGLEVRFNFQNMSADALAELLDNQVVEDEEADAFESSEET